MRDASSARGWPPPPSQTEIVARGIELVLDKLENRKGGCCLGQLSAERQRVGGAWTKSRVWARNQQSSRLRFRARARIFVAAAEPIL